MVAYINQNITESIYLGGVAFTSLNFQSNITYKIRLSAKLRNSGTAYVRSMICFISLDNVLF